MRWCNVPSQAADMTSTSYGKLLVEFRKRKKISILSAENILAPEKKLKMQFAISYFRIESA